MASAARVLAYYSKQDTSQLSDAALSQRSRALSLMAEVAYQRGDIDAALRLYREAMAGTAEAIRRKPERSATAVRSRPERLLDRRDARQRGQTAEAEAALREYKRLADRMVALAPDNMKWRMEQQSADANLGVLLFYQRRFGEATAQFTRAFRNIDALATADPENSDYQKALTEAEAWLADGQASQGHLAEAAALGEQHAALLSRLLVRTGDVEYRQKLVTAERNLGTLYAWRGENQKALEHLRAAVGHSQTLMTLEPTNSRWRGFSARARLSLADALLNSGRKDEAATETAAACSASARLVAADAKLQTWRAIVRECWDMRARIAAASGDAAQASAFAERAVTTARSVQSTDPIEDKFELAQTFRVLGDARKSLGDTAGAAAAWQAALGALPLDVAEKPNEMAERAMLLQRVGQSEAALQRSARLSAMGYRNPELRIG